MAETLMEAYCHKIEEDDDGTRLDVRTRQKMTLDDAAGEELFLSSSCNVFNIQLTCETQKTRSIHKKKVRVAELDRSRGAQIQIHHQWSLEIGLLAPREGVFKIRQTQPFTCFYLQCYCFKFTGLDWVLVGISRQCRIITAQIGAEYVNYVLIANVLTSFRLYMCECTVSSPQKPAVTFSSV